MSVPGLLFSVQEPCVFTCWVRNTVFHRPTHSTGEKGPSRSCRTVVLFLSWTEACLENSSPLKVIRASEVSASRTAASPLRVSFFLAGVGDFIWSFWLFKLQFQQMGASNLCSATRLYASTLTLACCLSGQSFSWPRLCVDGAAPPH